MYINTGKVGLFVAGSIVNSVLFIKFGNRRYEEGKIDAAKEIKETMLKEYNELAIQRLKRERAL